MHGSKRTSQLWPANWTKLHIYLTELDEIKPLVDSYRPVVSSADGEVPVQHEWLHATVASIECDAATVSAAKRHELAHALRQRLSGLPSFTVTAGPALATGTGIMLDLWPDEAFQALAAASVAVINDVIDGDAGRLGGGTGHVTLSYTREAAGVSADRGDIQNKLRDVRPGRSALAVNAIDLVDVTQHAEASGYSWETLARIPLAQ